MGVQSDNRFDDYNKGRHSVSKLVVHLVFTTKYRRKLLTRKMITQMKTAFDSASERLGCSVIEVNGEADHVHLLVEYPPKLAVSVMVNNLKSISSRYVRQFNAQLPTQSMTVGRLWSRAYFAASAGGATIEVLKAYVENQQAID